MALDKDESKLAYAVDCKINDKSGLTRWDDARKADGAKTANLLTPTLHQRTGNA